MNPSPKEQPKYIFGHENEDYVPRPAVSASDSLSTGHWDTRRDDYLNRLRGEFITDQPFSPEQDAIESLRDRDPDEVPDFPKHIMSTTVLSEYARHAISSAYTKAGRTQPEDQKEEEPPIGSDGGRVVTAEGIVAGYGWEDSEGTITSLVSLDGTIVDGPGNKEEGD